MQKHLEIFLLFQIHMINLVKTISTEFDNAKRRIIKFLRLGKEDVQTSVQASPFGSDTNPPANMRAIYVQTGVKGDTFIIGFINTDLVAEVGENRFFSTDKDGNLIFEARMRNDGTFEIGGSVDNLIRFNKLNIELQKLIVSLQLELANIAIGIVGVGGAYAPGVLSLNISSAKIDELKTS